VIDPFRGWSASRRFTGEPTREEFCWKGPIRPLISENKGEKGGEPELGLRCINRNRRRDRREEEKGTWKRMNLEENKKGKEEDNLRDYRSEKD